MTTLGEQIAVCFQMFMMFRQMDSESIVGCVGHDDPSDLLQLPFQHLLEQGPKMVPFYVRLKLAMIQ